jgi:hypothetical protein
VSGETQQAVAAAATVGAVLLALVTVLQTRKALGEASELRREERLHHLAGLVAELGHAMARGVYGDFKLLALVPFLQAQGVQLALLPIREDALVARLYLLGAERCPARSLT